MDAREFTREKPRIYGVFMADKDFNERAMIKELFPTATVLI